MKGTSRGDFSRLVFDPTRHYSAVRMQQGRVLLDADWNAQVDLAAHRLRTGTRDVIGAAGAPAEDPGFEIVLRSVLKFDGVGHRLLLAGEDLAQRTARGFTFEAWVEPRATDHPGLLFARLGRSRPGEPFQIELALALNPDGHLRLHRPHDRSSQLVSERTVRFGHPCHVALVAGEAGCALYLDGRPAGRDAVAIPAPAPESVLVVGAIEAHGGRHRSFEGHLYGLRLWGAARSAEEIHRGHRHARADAEEHLLGAWQCEGMGAEGSLPDRAGSGRTWRLGGGRPEHSPAWALRQIQVGAGRFYVDGLLCQNAQTVPFHRQPDHPAAALPELRTGDAHLFYLDAWESTVTAWQDRDLLDPALGGGDTTVRSRVIGQVKTLPLPRPDLPALPDLPDEIHLTDGAGGQGAPGADDWLAVWDDFVRRARHQGRLRARRVPSANSTGNRLYRVEVHSRGGAWGWPRPEGVDAVEINVLSAGDDGSRVQLAHGAREHWPQLEEGGAVEVYSPETDSQERPGLTATILSTESTDPGAAQLVLDTDLGPLAAHSRVMMRPLATFKWSRRNSSVIYPIVELEPDSQVVGLGSTGQSCLDLEVGDVVEVFDRESLLEPRPDRLFRIVDVDEASLAVTLDGVPALEPAAADPAELPRRVEERAPALRRWDQRPRDDRPLAGGAVPLAVKTWLPLEAGVEVFFEGDGPYRTGDYWLIPARTATDSPLWPCRSEGPDAGAPEALPPHGVEHHFAPLAVLALGEHGFRTRDCRRIFQPITTGAVSKAGDTMDGPLVIRSDLAVEGEILGGSLHGPLGSMDAVATFNLTDGAVTAPKLDPALGTVPPGYMILGESPEPPPRYGATGLFLTLSDHEAPWRAQTLLPRSEGHSAEGPFQAATLDGKLYLLLPSGHLWEHDPIADRWCARQPNPQPLHASAMAAAAGQLVVAGGEDAGGRKRGAVMTYDPVSDRWSAGTDMPTPRSHLALAELDGHLHAVGGLRRGWIGEWTTRRHERYDPVTERWERRAALPRGRYALAAGSVAGRFYAVGGVRRWFFGLWGRSLTNANSEYEPASNRWRPAAPLPTPRLQPGVAAVAGRLWAVGGEGLFGPLEDSEEYDPELDRWRRRPPLPEPLAGPGVGAVGGHLLATGPTGYGVESLVGAWESPVAVQLHLHRKLEPEEGESRSEG